ncbi:MAG: RagB/SusD family nutrient uptake outer membrane protein, partial [Prevotella sp.]|nr:RagB/SusD family nutrient uptake outer membrane protein [Prevotella sp.]
MKNKILNIALIGAALMATTSCSDYLETSSVSKTDGDFVFSNMVTARAAMNGAYTEWHGAISSHIFGDGLFYAFDIAGSDIMRHPEGYSKQLPRHQPESFYLNGTVAGTYDPVTYGK